MADSSFGTVVLIIVLLGVFLVVIGLIALVLYFVFKDEDKKKAPPNVNPTPGNNTPLSIQSIDNTEHYLFANNGTCAITHNAVRSTEPCNEMNWIFNSDNTLSPVGSLGNFLTVGNCITLATRGTTLVSDSNQAAKIVYNTANKTLCTIGNNSVCLHTFGGGIRNIATQFKNLPNPITSNYQWNTKEALTPSKFNAVCSAS